MAHVIDETRVMTWQVKGVNSYSIQSSSNFSRAADPIERPSIKVMGVTPPNVPEKKASCAE